MEQAVHIVSCPFCQGDNSPRSLRCRKCGETLVASLVVNSVVEPELAHQLASQLADRPAQIPRLEQRLVRGRGVLIRELPAGRAQKLALNARAVGVALEVRPLRILSAPPDGLDIEEKMPRRVRAALVLVALCVLILGVTGYLYKTATGTSLQAGGGWRSATIRAGRILPDLAQSPNDSALLSSQLEARIPPPAEATSISPATVQAVLPAMVRIQSMQGVCSGFFIDPSGLIISSYHPLQQGGPIHVTVEGKTYLARILRLSPAWDLALLKVDAPAPHVLSLADGARISVLTPVFTVGLAEGQSDSVRVGRVTHVGRSLDASAMLELDLAAPTDHAGAPVMDAQGHVVGIVSSNRPGSTRTTYAVLSNYLFDGEDALLRGIQPVQSLSEPFLRLQLKSLAEVGTRLRERRAGASDQAFVTAQGVLALVVGVERAQPTSVDKSPEPLGPRSDVQLEVWVRSEEGQPLLHRMELAQLVFPPGPAEQGGLYATVRLDAETHLFLQRAHRAKVEISVPSLGMRQLLRLNGIPDMSASDLNLSDLNSPGTSSSGTSSSGTSGSGTSDTGEL